MLNTAINQVLLAEDNLVTLERTSHAIRTYLSERKLEVAAMDEARIVRLAYENIVMLGLIGASYEQIFDAVRQEIESETHQAIHAVTGTALMMNDTSLRMRSKRFWWQTEQRRKSVIVVLFVLLAIVGALVTWQISGLLSDDGDGGEVTVEDFVPPPLILNPGRQENLTERSSPAETDI